jgi:hypothetical protein
VPLPAKRVADNDNPRTGKSLRITTIVGPAQRDAAQGNAHLAAQWPVFNIIIAPWRSKKSPVAPVSLSLGML